MNEPFYHQGGPDKEYIYKDIMNHFKKDCKQINMAYSILNYGYLSLLVKKLIEKELLIGGFGSCKGYISLSRQNLIETINDNLIERNKKIALFIIKNPLEIHINRFLYMPGKTRFKDLERIFKKKVGL